MGHDKGTISKIVLGKKASEEHAEETTTLATLTTDVDIEPNDEVHP